MCRPWMLVWNGDCYYLLGHTDKHGVTPFRLDRIAAPAKVKREYEKMLHRAVSQDGS